MPRGVPAHALGKEVESNDDAEIEEEDDMLRVELLLEKRWVHEEFCKWTIFEDPEDELRYYRKRARVLPSFVRAVLLLRSEGEHLQKAGLSLQEAFERSQDELREAVGDVAYWRELAEARAEAAKEYEALLLASEKKLCSSKSESCVEELKSQRRNGEASGGSANACADVGVQVDERAVSSQDLVQEPTVSLRYGNTTPPSQARTPKLTSELGSPASPGQGSAIRRALFSGSQRGSLHQVPTPTRAWGPGSMPRKCFNIGSPMRRGETPTKVLERTPCAASPAPSAPTVPTASTASSAGASSAGASNASVSRCSAPNAASGSAPSSGGSCTTASCGEVPLSRASSGSSRGRPPLATVRPAPHSWREPLDIGLPMRKVQPQPVSEGRQSEAANARQRSQDEASVAQRVTELVGLWESKKQEPQASARKVSDGDRLRPSSADRAVKPTVASTVAGCGRSSSTGRVVSRSTVTARSGEDAWEALSSVV